MFREEFFHRSVSTLSLTIALEPLELFRKQTKMLVWHPALCSADDTGENASNSVSDPCLRVLHWYH
jgi:hypothetical protein